MKFFCINDFVPTETIQYLKSECISQSIEFCEINASNFSFLSYPCEQDDILFRPAVSQKAVMVEQFLYNEKLTTFYADPEGPLFLRSNPRLIHAKKGLPVPRYYPCLSFQTTLILQQIELLGGFPLIVKIPGASRGIGVIKVSSVESLLSLLEYILSLNKIPLLMSYIPNSVHWRVIVVGDRVVAAYKNPIIDNDFRTIGSTNTNDIFTEVRDDLAQIAIQSLQCLRLEFGGVDLLEHESGRIYLLESNFPCYFLHAQIYGGINICQKMLDFLISKSKRS